MYSIIHDVLCCCFKSSGTTTATATSSSTTSTPGSSASFYYLQGDWVVHERQLLQLCAVHTINNLLQLTHDDRDLPWICGNRIIQWTTNTHHDATASANSSQFSLLPLPASQVELDRIACDLMRAEDALLDHSNRHHHEGNYSYCCWLLPSFRCCHSWNNTHRTLYYGNYSFETLEVALQRRHVSLEWFHIPTNPDELLKVPTGMVVGFIINHIMNDDDDNDNDNHHQRNNNNNNNNNTSSSSNRKSFPRSVWKKCCDDPGRHWYAISRVRRRSDGLWNATTKNNENGGIDDVINQEAPEEDRWKILDSDRMGEATILRTDEVREYLHQVSDHDATIFRATLILP
jgi:hypothetical protein